MSTSSAKLIELEQCVACCCCEIACSFHHTKGFQPARSSIQVHRDEKTGNMTISVSPTCDLCQDEEEPLCIQFCPREGVLSRDLIAGLRPSAK